MPRAGLDAARVTSAAAAIVDAEGTDALTLARVAAALGVASPSLYKHVGGLDDLRRRVTLHASRELGAALAPAAVGRAGPEALRALAAAYRAFALEHPGWYPLAQRAPNPDDAEHQAVAAASLDTLAAALTAYDLTGENAVHAIRLVRATLHGLVDLEREGGFAMPVSLESTYALAIEHLDAALRHIAARSPGSDASSQ